MALQHKQSEYVGVLYEKAYGIIEQMYESFTNLTDAKSRQNAHREAHNFLKTARIFERQFSEDNFAEREIHDRQTIAMYLANAREAVQILAHPVEVSIDQETTSICIGNFTIMPAMFFAPEKRWTDDGCEGLSAAWMAGFRLDVAVYHVGDSVTPPDVDVCPIDFCRDFNEALFRCISHLAEHQAQRQLEYYIPDPAFMPGND